MSSRGLTPSPAYVGEAHRRSLSDATPIRLCARSGRPTHHPLGAILQKFERRGDVFAKAIEAGGCGRHTASGALLSSGDFAERCDEALSM